MRLPVVLAADLSFLLLGDWGGSEDGSTSGERDTSKGMEKVASALESSFVLALGDNFYPAGVTSKTEKKRFKSTYEDVYTGKCLQNTWYAIAGNHDHSGDVKSQIEYSDGRWHFPSLYYTFNKTLDNGKTAEFVMFDSVVLSGLSYRDDETGEFVAAPGPADAQAAEDQWAWIEAQLAQSTADYLFTAAHYPVWSVCKHGPTDALKDRLRPLLAKYRVTAHLSGHDHCLEYIMEGDVAHVVSGAGALAWYDEDKGHKEKVEKDANIKWSMSEKNRDHYDGGFASITLGDSAKVVFYGNDGTTIHTADPLPPRSKQYVV